MWLILLLLAMLSSLFAQPQVPTYNGLTAFLEADKTNEISRSEDFGCLDFATAIYHNAKAEGMRVAVVLVLYPEGVGHALNAFYTIDKGLVFIDCSTGWDAIAQIEIDEPYSTSYSQTVGNKSFAAGTVGSIIVDYRIVWDIDRYSDAWLEMVRKSPVVPQSAGHTRPSWIVRMWENLPH